jgi:RluA family pseudouridine synthase
MGDLLKILYEDAHLILVDKPAGLATQGAGESLESRILSHLRSRPDHEVYLGTVHRLDKPVSGVIVWAKTPKAARRLAAQFAARQVRKEYWALVDRAPIPERGTWNDWLRDGDSTPGKIAIGGEADPGARLATTRYERRDDRDPSWLVLQPETGRTHQLRVQCSARKMPILGDERYGSARSFPIGIALHARRLVFQHPMIERSLEIVAELPASWDDWGRERG